MDLSASIPRSTILRACTDFCNIVYHIHGMPVSADGNCTATMGHLDPTNRGEYHPCEDTQPETCQAGDLAGKHGNITGTTFSAR